MTRVPSILLITRDNAKIGIFVKKSCPGTFTICSINLSEWYTIDAKTFSRMGMKHGASSIKVPNVSLMPSFTASFESGSVTVQCGGRQSNDSLFGSNPATILQR